jgi:predicted GIY-YIG superfamily endonuclease
MEPVTNKYYLQAKECVESFNDEGTYLLLPETIKKFSLKAKGYQIIRNGNFNDIRVITLADLKRKVNPFNDLVSTERQLCEAREIVSKWNDGVYRILDETVKSKFNSIRQFKIVKNEDHTDIRLVELGNLRRNTNPFRSGGFNDEIPGSLYVVLLKKNNTEYVGYGITNFFDRRMKEHIASLKKNYWEMTVMMRINDECGKSLRELESKIKKIVTPIDIGIAGFKRECVHLSEMDNIMKVIKNYVHYRQHLRLDQVRLQG